MGSDLKEIAAKPPRKEFATFSDAPKQKAKSQTGIPRFREGCPLVTREEFGRERTQRE